MQTKLRKVLFILALVVLFILPLSACAPGVAQAQTLPNSQSGDVQLDPSADGSQIELQPGQSLSVRLPSNPTTGYRWEVAQLDAAVLAQQGEADYQQASDGQLTGAGGQETFLFQAGQSGQTTLKLVYHRPWETVADPASAFEVTVLVP